jgi:CBS domain-containing protein
MKVHEIMIRHVECIDPETPIAKAASKMRDRDIGFLPICENDRLVGAVTDRDITVRSVAQGRDPWVTPVREIMTPQVLYCYEDDDVHKVGHHMQEQEVRRMLILNREKRLVGIVSLGDLARTSGEKQLAGETLGHIAEAA